MASSTTQDKFNTFMQLRNTPEARGLFRAIAGPEGTLKPDGSFAYYRQFGGNDLDPSRLGSGHPNQVINKNGYSSAATGFAQFMPDTWKMANQALGGQLDFRKPEHQEAAALYLASRRTEGLGGIASLKDKGLTKEFVAKLAPEWASFPTLAGASAYGQPSKPYENILKLYNEGLGQTATTAQSSAGSQNDNSNTAVTPAIAPTTDGQGIVVSQANGAAPITVNVNVNGKGKSENSGVESYLKNFIANAIPRFNSNPLLSQISKNTQFFKDLDDDEDPIYTMSA
jgi:muramidase (phage lysozyme)